MLIMLFSSSSFGDNISDKLRRISLQKGFNISTNFLEYYGIVGAVPKGWKKLIST
jgi:hypothetical protein